MAGKFYEPQTPLMQGGDFYYPQTTAGQVILPDGRRLGSAEKLNLTASDVNALSIDTSNGIQGEAAGINADTLGGIDAANYLRKTDIATDSENLGGIAASDYVRKTDTIANATNAENASLLGGQPPKYYAKQETVDQIFAASFINENTTYTTTGFPAKPTSASNTVFTTPADGIFYLFATRGESAGNTIQAYVLKPTGETVARFNMPAYYAYAVCSLTIPVKRGMKIMVNTDKDTETWQIREQLFFY